MTVELPEGAELVRIGDAYTRDLLILMSTGEWTHPANVGSTDSDLIVAARPRPEPTPDPSPPDWDTVRTYMARATIDDGWPEPVQDAFAALVPFVRRLEAGDPSALAALEAAAAPLPSGAADGASPAVRADGVEAVDVGDEVAPAAASSPRPDPWPAIAEEWGVSLTELRGAVAAVGQQRRLVRVLGHDGLRYAVASLQPDPATWRGGPASRWACLATYSPDGELLWRGDR